MISSQKWSFRHRLATSTFGLLIYRKWSVGLDRYHGVFKVVLNAVLDWICLISRGRGFQTEGASQEKERRANVSLFTYVMHKVLDSEEERSCLDGDYTRISTGVGPRPSSLLLLHWTACWARPEALYWLITISLRSKHLKGSKERLFITIQTHKSLTVKNDEKGDEKRNKLTYRV